jgi:hypothetical protein
MNALQKGKVYERLLLTRPGPSNAVLGLVGLAVRPDDATTPGSR